LAADATTAATLPPDLLDRLGEAFWWAWGRGGGEGEGGWQWTDLPEQGRADFRAMAQDMIRRAGLAEALAATAAPGD